MHGIMFPCPGVGVETDVGSAQLQKASVGPKLRLLGFLVLRGLGFSGLRV